MTEAIVVDELTKHFGTVEAVSDLSPAEGMAFAKGGGFFLRSSS